MPNKTLTQIVVDALDALKAQDLCVLDVRELASFTDYMVIASGRSNRQVKALADNVVMAAKKAGIRPLGVEGMVQGEWVLVDLGDVVVHTMQPVTRDFYQLEKLWVDTGSEAVSQ